MTTANKEYFTSMEALEDIIDYLNGIDEEGSIDTDEVFNDVFNSDYYIIGWYEAEQSLIQYGVFDAIAKVMDYEENMFGEVSTDLSNSERVANMLYYIIGEEVMHDLVNELLTDYAFEEITRDALLDLANKWLVQLQ